MKGVFTVLLALGFAANTAAAQGKCKSIDPSVSDAWCMANCSHSPVNCPTAFCSCSSEPTPPPPPPPPLPTLPTPPPRARVDKVESYATDAPRALSFEDDDHPGRPDCCENSKSGDYTQNCKPTQSCVYDIVDNKLVYGHYQGTCSCFHAGYVIPGSPPVPVPSRIDTCMDNKCVAGTPPGWAWSCQDPDNFGVCGAMASTTYPSWATQAGCLAAPACAPDPSPSPHGDDSSYGGIVGGIFAGVVVGAAALLFVRKRRAARSSSSLPADAGAAAKMQQGLSMQSANPVGPGIPVIADATAAGKVAPCSSCGASSTGAAFCSTCGTKA